MDGKTFEGKTKAQWLALRDSPNEYFARKDKVHEALLYFEVEEKKAQFDIEERRFHSTRRIAWIALVISVISLFVPKCSMSPKYPSQDAVSSSQILQSQVLAATKAEDITAQEKAQAFAEAISERHQQLDNIVDDLQRQIKLQSDGVDVGFITSNQAVVLYDEYTKSYREAEAQLQATQLDLSVPLPSTKYLDDEIKFGLLQRR